MAPLPGDHDTAGISVASVAYGWYGDGPSKVQPPALEPEFLNGVEEVLARLSGKTWLFPPGVELPPEVAEAQPAPVEPSPTECFDLRDSYQFEFLKTPMAQEVVQLLLAPGKVPTGKGALRDGHHGDKRHIFQVQQVPLTDAQRQQCPFLTDLEPYQYCSNHRQKREAGGYVEYECLGHNATKHRKYGGTLRHHDGRIEQLKVCHGFLTVGAAAPKPHTTTSPTGQEHCIGIEGLMLCGTIFGSDGSISGEARSGEQVIGSFELRLEESLAMLFSRALGQFAFSAFKALTAMNANRQPRLPEEERTKLVPEANRVVKMLVTEGHIIPERDLNFALEAYGMGRGRLETEISWPFKCLSQVIGAILTEAGPGTKERWVEQMKSKLQDELEVCSYVDIRAWPHIFELLGATSEMLKPEIFKFQLQNQLNLNKFDGARQAAEVVQKLKMQEHFELEEFLDIFSNRQYFEPDRRRQLLQTALAGADAEYIQGVLHELDDQDKDGLAERDDQAMKMEEDLLRHFKQDIRCCTHTYFKMKREWLIQGRNSGVLALESLSPEQICDHIEDDENREELLKLAVNRLWRLDRQFEAAKILARPQNQNTAAYEALRNQNQITYLMSLYQGVEEPIDHFGPIEAEALQLPHQYSEILTIDCVCEELRRLEADLLTDKKPAAVSLAWFWRCFNPQLDFWPRASALAIAYESSQGPVLALVDFMAIEGQSLDEEHQCKSVLRRIVEADWLLKVVHGLDQTCFDTLWRAILPRDELYSSTDRPALEPVVDLAVVAACAARTRPSALAATRLPTLAFNYLRLELCLSEALSNFERRPLRLTQKHYMLSMAWCPLMILRAMCAFPAYENKPVLTNQELAYLTIRLDHSEDQKSWSPYLQDISFGLQEPDPSWDGAPGDDDDGNIVTGPFGKDVLSVDDEAAVELRTRLPRPDRRQPLGEFMPKHLNPIVLKRQEQINAFWPVTAALASAEVATRDLTTLYQVWNAKQNQPDGQP